MNFFKFFISAVCAAAIFYFFNTRITTPAGKIPPVGKFLNPYTGFWQNVLPADRSPTLHLPSLLSPVEVKYDSNGIPHIFAGNLQDLSLASGYVTASQRLWQMELVTHYAGGRLSEIFGDVTLAVDREYRRKGMTWSAQRTLKEWEKNDDIKEMLDAYALGVNHYIESLSYENYPIEYKILDYKPEAWEPLKSALLFKYMSHMLTTRETDIENTHFVKTYGKEMYDLLFPDFPEGVDPVVPAGVKYDFEASLAKENRDSLFSMPFIAQVYDKPNPGLGSNNWAVGAAKSKSGNALLANDMHLTLNLPPIWFLAQYHTPDFNAFGHVLPGSPFIVQGFNDSISWGFTNAYRDLVDWYGIRFRNSERNEYFYEGKWLHAQKEIEHIKVREGADVYDTVVYTHHGPVVYDRNFLAEDPKVNLAMKWIAHSNTLEPLCFRKLLSARNHSDFTQAIQFFSCPPQSMAYADARGNIAMHVQGRFPVKYPDQGKFVMDGTTEKTEWPGTIPQDQNPHALNPTQGFVSSANQHPTDATYPYPIHINHYEYYRNRRINKVLAQKDSISLDDLKNLQMDSYSLKAEEYLPFMLDSLDENPRADAGAILQELKNWDFRYEARQAAPAYFEIWCDQLLKLAWKDLVAADYPMPIPSAYHTLWLLKNRPELTFFGQQNGGSKSNVTTLINTAFEGALKEIRDWQLENPGQPLDRAGYFSSRVMHYARLKPFSVENIIAGGSPHSVNALGVGHGPSERIVIEMGSDIKAWHNLPGGQSGHPGDPHYLHFMDAWIKGEYFPVLFMKNKDDHADAVILSQTLSPETE